MSTIKTVAVLATAVLSFGIAVASAQPQAILDQPEELGVDAAHAESSASLSDPNRSSAGYRRAMVETMLDNKVEVCRRHLATFEASAAEADAYEPDGRVLSLFGGALRGKPSAAAKTGTTAAKKPPQIDRRMLSEYGRQLEEVSRDRLEGNDLDNKRKLNHQRELFEVLFEFPECRCLEVEDCMSFIQKEHYNNQNGGPAPDFQPRLIRNYDQNNYNQVAIRPCDDNVHACGVDGDGLITYPFAWIVEGTGYQIGPWDCMSTGMKLTTDQCCDFIKASVPVQDDRGRNIQCHVTPDERLHPEADPNTIIIPFDPITHSVAGVPHTN